MKKTIIKFSALICAVTMVSLGVIAPHASAVETTLGLIQPILVMAPLEEDLDDVLELVEAVIFDEEEDLEIGDISDEELLEAEPSDLPEAVPDEALTNRLLGRMLLDVEGNGEVYYIDPVTGGKEYLADGESAQLLLRRRALGINEENFAKLIIGEEKGDSNVCGESELSDRLRGRIVLRTEEHGEAYWIFPENCRAYYAGTFEASYELMKRFSLGISKTNLAKIANNKRQDMKNALRLSVYAHAEDSDMSLTESREDLSNNINVIKECMEDFRESHGENPTSEENKERVQTCVKDLKMPRINDERRTEVKEMIKETREERRTLGETGEKPTLRNINIGQIIERVKTMIRNRVEQNDQQQGGAMNGGSQ